MSAPLATRALCVVLVTTLCFAFTPVARAQDARSPRDDVREEFDIDDQGHRAALLYGLGFTTFGLALTGFIGASIAAADGEGDLVDPRVVDGPRRTFWEGSTEGMFVVFGVAAAAGIGMVIAALILDLDAHRRRDELRDRRQERLSLDVSVSASPEGGGGGLRLRF